MTSASTLVLATVALGAGTLALRLSGSALRSRLELSTHAERLMTVGVVAIFAALVATASLLDGQGFAGWARPAGVAVAGILAWRRAPFVVVVVAAAGTAAALRAAGVS